MRFLNRSILVPLTLIIYWTVETFFKEVEYVNNIFYQLAGIMICYGAILIVSYLFVQEERKLILSLGIVYILLGSMFPFLNSLFSDYYFKIIGVLALLHGLSKIIINSSKGVFIKTYEVVIGIGYLVLFAYFFGFIKEGFIDLIYRLLNNYYNNIVLGLACLDGILILLVYAIPDQEGMVRAKVAKVNTIYKSNKIQTVKSKPQKQPKVKEEKNKKQVYKDLNDVEIIDLNRFYNSNRRNN